MSNLYVSRHCKAASLMRHTAVAMAASLALVSGAVHAQSTTNGNVYGQVAAKSGTVILLENVDTGAKRSITPEADGRFQATALLPGTYRAQLTVDGKIVSTDTVDVLAGQGIELNFSKTSLETVQVTGRRQTIDVSRSNSGATFTAKEMAALPVSQSIASIVQLAPNTTKADFRYGNNAASFGGSGSSENAIYINGFTATNGMFQVGYSSLPFGSIASTNIITGGYGAEFGRSTGGVINITTKSGSNDWEVGLGMSWAPNFVRSTQRDIVYENTGSLPATDGKVFYYNRSNTQDEKIYNLSLSGPIIKDKLFFYVAGELAKRQQEGTRLSSAATGINTTGWLKQKQEVPRVLVKLDWNITDNHHLEYTGIRDKTKTKDHYTGFDYTTLQHNDIVGGGADFVNYAAGVPFLTATGAAMSTGQGADLNILKYTGYMTDNLTVQALVGTSKTVRSQVPLGYVNGLYPVTAAVENRAPGISYDPTQVQGFTGSILRPDAHDKNLGYRFDIEYRLGSAHTLRAGVDSNHIKAANGTSAAGGGAYVYLKSPTPTQLSAGMTATPASTGSPLGAQGYYVSENHQAVGSTPQVRQAAQYIEDRFQATKQLLLTFGLRNEQFTNYNGQDEKIIEKKKQLAPRFSAAWDVNGDSSMKVFGTAGRYHLQIPANLAVRFAGGSLNTQHFYTYTGVDPATGAPIGKASISGEYSPNNEYGVQPNARSIAATDIRSNTQDEFTIGIEKALTKDWIGGVRVNYRNLVSSIDDVSDPRPFAKYLSASEYSYLESNWQGALFNPGKSNTFVVPVGGGQFKTVTIPWAEWGFPEGVKRKYYAVDLSLEHPMRSGWYAKLNYTYASSRGNTEGQQKSDNGQADVGFTSVWDFPENMINSDGPLPNMRKHQFKAFGIYDLNEEVSLSANALIASGRPRSCTQTLPPAQDPLGLSSGYGAIFYVCPNAPGRGALGTLPWETRLDLAVMYKPKQLKGLTFKVDVFNVFDRQTGTAVNEARTTAAGALNSQYQMYQNYTAPRAIQFSAQYNHKF